MRLFLIMLFVFLFDTTLYAKQLIIGTLSYSPPFETVADKKGNFFGFDIDIMNEICKRLHDSCQYKALPFEGLFQEIQSAQIDLAIAAIAITPERLALFSFSISYLPSKGQLLTSIDSPINNVKGFDGKRIGVQSGSLYEKLASNTFVNAIIIEEETQQDLIEAISKKKVDAIFCDEASAQYWIDSNDDLFKTVGAGIPVGLGYGIMANTNNIALIKRINKILSDMAEDGKYLSIYKQYFNVALKK